ncbi:hypothetical protein ERJ75_001444500 [Trypanosoma vivax]|uniref:Uncharacterized protein n=1 Tax=Trypanosoma vivax (strain Y486) TaxID=1055687 RepID=G0U857_TRYVY|nr:hypothetical protein TRVL_06565 [Trypanosoma vivax]KAH8607121.1 hypothetical protein ERJ75_001444500 [Trypanosoma vivax]CCC52066.1 conserved hypothetical protein [Trypanosoma vivax Y486]
MRSGAPLVRRTVCLLTVKRRVTTTSKENKREGRLSDSNGARQLRALDWLYLDPVEKWTTLVDLGRRAPTLLESTFAFPTVAAMGRKMSTVVRRLVRWPLRLRRKKLSVASVEGGNDGVKATEHVWLSQAAVQRHASLVSQLPYSVRLQLCLSFLMWVQSLRNTQDTLARLRMPFAKTRRVQRSVVADVFPTSFTEICVDSCTTVSLLMDANLNDTGEQIPAPYAWRPEGYYEDAAPLLGQPASTSSGRRLSLSSSIAGPTVRSRKRHRSSRYGSGINCTKATLREVQDMHAMASDDDPVARPAQRSGQCRLQGQLEQLARTTSSPTSGPVWSLSDAQRSQPPSPLAVAHEDDEKYHHNINRGEGCPLDETGRLHTVPIHIPIPLNADKEKIMLSCVAAHASILSSLYIEGRTVCFTTNHYLLRDYVAFLFDEMVADGWISVAVTDQDLHPYLPPWCIAETVLVILPPLDEKLITEQNIREMATRIVQNTPCSILMEAPLETGGVEGNFLMRLMRETERQKEEVGEQQCRSSWRLSWVPLDVTLNVGAYQQKADASGVGAFKSKVNDILRGSYTVTFLYVPNNCIFAQWELQQWWWTGLPSSIHVVGANACALDVLYYFPQATFLSKKIGNSHRYRSVQRVIIKKTTAGENAPFMHWFHRLWQHCGQKSTGLCSRLPVRDRRSMLSDLQCREGAESAQGALRWERTIDYLANPGKSTWFALLAARLFHV